METNTMGVQPIPNGYHTITPYLLVKGAAGVLEFMKQAFGAVERHRSEDENGIVRHAEVQVGTSMAMVAEAHGEWKAMPCMLYLYVEDVDAVYARALQAGGTSLREPTNEFYGDRSCGVQDASGVQWWIATHVEDVSPEEMMRREAEANAKKAKANASADAG